MNRYLYRWHLQPHDGVRVELEVAARNAATARRTVEHFLRDHDGTKWVLEAVSRKICAAPAPARRPPANTASSRP